MKAMVFHANTEVVRADGRSAFDGEAKWPSEFACVAVVEVPDGGNALELAFSRTNHIDAPWWECSSVQRMGPETRSTSTGDVVVVDSKAYMCASAGWKELS